MTIQTKATEKYFSVVPFAFLGFLRVKTYFAFKGFSLLWKCHLRNDDYNNTLEAFRRALDLIDPEENREKEFVDLFTTAMKQKGKKLHVPLKTLKRIILHSTPLHRYLVGEEAAGDSYTVTVAN